MNIDSITPYRMALLDYFSGDRSARLIIHRDDGYRDDHCMHVYFQNVEQFSPTDKAAVDLSRGRILDIGAGAGRHSLALQALGYQVCAVDICTEAVHIMRKRGVRDVRCVDVFDMKHVSFDTLLIMMHGVGILKNLSGLDRFLRHARALVASEGQILMDSVDMRQTRNPVHLAYQEFNRRCGRYFGETRLVFEYQGIKGSSFEWLQVDPETLREYARNSGWNCSISGGSPRGDYLARLQLAE